MILQLGKLNLQLGALFFWKLGLLLAILAASVWIFRPFCKYLCPLGAIYGLMNRVALVRLHCAPERCTHCGACARACPMQADPAAQPDSPECIRCGKCVGVCPTEALRCGVRQLGKTADKPRDMSS